MEATLDNILDVTLLEPRQKHPTIFSRFDELAEGESLIIHNDHDPKPLYYQLLGERGNVFTWEYLEQGPVWFRIKIRKNVSGENEETLGEIAVKDLRKVDVFKKYGIDFCCGGKKTVRQVCEEKGLDFHKIEQELQQIDKAPISRAVPYDDWAIDFLADYIVNTHHSYVKKSIPDLLAYTNKIMKVHGHGHPELAEVYELTSSIAKEMTHHMGQEEEIVFVYAKELAKADKNSVLDNDKISIITEMEKEHDAVGRMLERIRFITNDYELPADSCATYALTFKLLQEFEDDLFIHIHLENNILFPKMVKLQDTFASKK